MVDQALLERVLQLDEDARRELLSALQGSLGETISAEVARIVDERVASADATPERFVSLRAFEREVRTQRSA
ncbi:MAG TPA: hypothetical protein PKE40_12460 [Arachnia sp.]|nr:hypothetical protein [Arachnia sp.]HMT87156.1 hypothetical protein [Arachnia sp.]